MDWRNCFKKEIKKFGESGLALKGLRYREGLTRKDLSMLLNISPSELKALENGKSVKKELTKALSALFKIDKRVFR